MTELEELSERVLKYRDELLEMRHAMTEWIKCLENLPHA